MTTDEITDDATITIPQIWKAFFLPEDGEQAERFGTPTYIVPPTRHDLNWMLDPANPDYTITPFLGNAKVINALTRAAKAALARPDHLCNDNNFVLLGPSSDKATLARSFAALLKLPFVAISPKTINCLNDIVVRTAEALEAYDLGDGQTNELAGVGDNGKIITCPPPIVMFIDGVNFLSDDVVEGLVEAMDKDDGFLDTGSTIMVCKYVCWIIVAERIGDLPKDLVKSAIRLRL